MNQKAKRQTGLRGNGKGPAFFLSMAVEPKRSFSVLFTVALARVQILQRAARTQAFDRADAQRGGTERRSSALTEHAVGLHLVSSISWIIMRQPTLLWGLQILRSWDLDLAATLGYRRPPPNPI